MSGFRLSDNGRVLRPYGTGKKIVRGILPGEHADDAVTKAQLDAVQEGSVDLSRVEFSADGTAAAPVLTWNGDTDTGLFRSAANTVDFTAGGTSQFQLSDGTILPTTDNDIALGSASKKFISLSLVDGTVGALPIRIGADGNNGIYGVSDTQLGLAVEGALSAMIDTVGVKTASVGELVADAGVSFPHTIYLTQTPQTLTGAGAVNLTTQTTLLVTTGANALTLAAGTAGQIKIITMKTDGGDGTLTPTGLRGGTTITFNDVGDTVVLMAVDSAWIILSNFGCTVA